MVLFVILFNAELFMKVLQNQQSHSIKISLIKYFNPTKLFNIIMHNNRKKSRKEKSNFLAKYKYGNRHGKGIINMHVNIRSLKNKMQEVKNLVQYHNPHILGLSETEINKNNVNENKLKIPGYDTIFPKSWDISGTARVLVYVKKSFEYEHIEVLESNSFQSIWIRGHLKNTRNIYFCHGYREHMSDTPIAHQRDILNEFVYQWEYALEHENVNDVN